MSITIESSDNREYFKKSAYNRFYDFYTQYIPKHLPKWGTPNENGIYKDWTNSFEGYTSIIDYVVDEAIKTIIERPENNVVEFQLKALKNTIDLWTPEWDKEFAIYAISVFNSADAPKASDAYMTLYTMGYMDDEEPKTQVQSNKVLNSMSWVHSKPLDKALTALKPLSYLFEEGSLEGLKMALGGGNVYDIKGCLKPSYGNTTAVRYLIHNLQQEGYINEVYSMDLVMSVLMESSKGYRKVKSKFVQGEYTLDQAKDDLILTCINNLSK